MPRTDENINRQNRLAESEILYAMADAIEKKGEEAQKNGLSLNCEKPGERWGWKIDSDGIRIVECGCYDEAVWPTVLSLGAGPVLKTIGQKVSPKLLKLLARRYAKRFRSDFVGPMRERLKEISKALSDKARKGYEVLSDTPFGKISTGNLFNFQWDKWPTARSLLQAQNIWPISESTRKVPWWVGKAGRVSNMQNNALGITGWKLRLIPANDEAIGTIVLFLQELEGVHHFKLMPERGWFQGLMRGNRPVFTVYIDTGHADDIAKIAKACDKELGRSIIPLKYSKNDTIIPGTRISARIDARNMPNREIGEIHNLTIKDPSADKCVVERYLKLLDSQPDNMDFYWPRNTSVGDNGKSVTGYMLYLQHRMEMVTERMARESEAGIKFLIEQSSQQLSALQKEYSRAKKIYDRWFDRNYPQFKLPKTKELANNLADETLAAVSDFDRLLDTVTDEIFDREDYLVTMSKFLEEASTLNRRVQTTFIEASEEINLSRLDSIIDLSSFIVAMANLVGIFSYVISFATAILSFLSVVVDKECSFILLDENIRSNTYGPSDPKIRADPVWGKRGTIEGIVDSIFFEGKWKGYTSRFGFSDKKIICPNIEEALGSNPSWDLIYKVLIDNKLPVWPTMNDCCECADCPSGYKLCSYSNIVNLYSDSYNICLPVCGGQILKPVDIVGVATRANCERGCPDDHIWVQCVKSDCSDPPVSCSDSSEESNKGFCVQIPPELTGLRLLDFQGVVIRDDIKYGSLIWDPIECRWVCRNGKYVMDWTRKDGPDPRLSADNPVVPVYVDDERFAGVVENITPGGPGGVGGLKLIVKFKFRPDRIEFPETPCEENEVRLVSNSCECSSGSYDDDESVDAPEGYVYFDGKLIPIVEDDSSSSDESVDCAFPISLPEFPEVSDTEEETCSIPEDNFESNLSNIPPYENPDFDDIDDH